MKKKPLGRGLGALIPNAQEGENSSENSRTKQKTGVAELNIADIHPNKKQPRTHFDEEHLKELVESIKQKGIIQPLVVTPDDEGYMIIAGERRWRASGLAGLKKIPVVIKNVETESERLELALIENIQREDLNSVELAVAYKNLMDTHGYRQEDVATVIGKSRSSIANTIRLLSLPEKVIEALKENLITEGHARCLITVDDNEKIISLLKRIIEDNLSVRETERLASRKQIKKEQKQSEDKNVFVLSLIDELEGYFNTRVNIKSKAKGGTIEIQYSSEDELDRIIKTIRGE